MGKGRPKGLTHTEETKRKLSAVMKLRLDDPDTRRKMSAAQRGRIHSPEDRAKISAGRRRQYEGKSK